MRLSVPVVLEGNFKTWSLIIDKTNPNSGGQGNLCFISVDNNGNVIMVETQLAPPEAFNIDSSGNITTLKTNVLANNAPANSLHQSMTGKYKIFVDQVIPALDVIQGSSVLFAITIDTTTKFVSTAGNSYAISPNGQYIAIVGTDFTNNAINRIQIWSGS